MINTANMFLNASSKLLPTMFRRLEHIPASTSVMDNSFRHVLNNYTGEDFNSIGNDNYKYLDHTITLKNFDNFRVMMGILPSKEYTYYHNNRHIKILKGDVEVSFNSNDRDKFKFNKNNAITIGSPHYLFNETNETTKYIWIEEIPLYQNTLII